MEFDLWTVLLLHRQSDPPNVDSDASDAIQDAHLAYLERLHADGRLVAAGPVRGPEGKTTLAGFCIYCTGLDETRALGDEDPAVKAGIFRVEVFSWMVPRGAMKFDPVRFPRSMAEAEVPE